MCRQNSEYYGQLTIQSYKAAILITALLFLRWDKLGSRSHELHEKDIMIIAFTTWTWRPNSSSKEAYGWSFWKKSRDFCLWIMQTRFISDAFIFILGKTCQILFYDVYVATSAGQLGPSIDFLTSWLPVFLDLFKRSQIFLKWTQTEILTKISYHIFAYFIF